MKTFNKDTAAQKKSIDEMHSNANKDDSVDDAFYDDDIGKLTFTLKFLFYINSFKFFKKKKVRLNP